MRSERKQRYSRCDDESSRGVFRLKYNEIENRFVRIVILNRVKWKIWRNSKNKSESDWVRGDDSIMTVQVSLTNIRGDVSILLKLLEDNVSIDQRKMVFEDTAKLKKR